MNRICPVLLSALVLTGFTAAYAQSEELVVLETSFGDITIEFFPNDAPNHVENFLTLTESGFYDGVLFHRIIPDFMIQGGDPNTISGDPSSWGQGGPDKGVGAEFNTIKHNRGIVSMARSADPDSAGSQFFIVHKDSNFLDEQYTVFGRIVTQQSFDTLDKIAAVPTGDRDVPTDPESVKIISAKIVDRLSAPDLLELNEPERTQTTPSLAEPQKYESDEHDVSFTAPSGWLLQTIDDAAGDVPNVVAVGPKIGMINPVISLTVKDIQTDIDEIIEQKDARLKEEHDNGNLVLLSNEKKTINGLTAYEANVESPFTTDDQEYTVKFKEITLFGSEKYYVLTYNNDMDIFDSQLPLFEETLDSFKILSESQDASRNDESARNDAKQEPKDNGGCLVATATFGSELAPQVQQLREIRDNVILPTQSGSAFMSAFNEFYYSFSPGIADMQRENPAFRELVKLSITPLLLSLSILQHADSESEVIGYGIGIILLNIGMYVAAPAMMISRLKR